MTHTSASMTKTSEELGLSLTTSDSAYIDNIAADCHHNAATTTPLPGGVSLSPFSHWNINETSQYYDASGNSNIGSSDDGTNASFNPTDISANRPQVANPRRTSMSGDIQSLLNTNLGMTQFNPNQAESNTIMPKVNVAGNSERAFHSPINTYHNQLGSRSFSNPDLDMNNAFTGFPKDGGTSSNFTNAGHHDESCGSRERRVDGQLVSLSSGMVTDQSPSEILPENNGKFSSRSIPIPPLVVDTRSTRVQNPSSHNGQSQVVGSIQQSSFLPRQHSASDQAIQTVKENRSAQQVSRPPPPIISSLKRPASQPLAYTLQDQRRKTLPTQPFIHQSVPTWTRLAPSVPNTPQPIPPLIHTALSPTVQATQSSFSPLLPYTPSLPNTTQVIAPPIPPGPSLPPIDQRTSSFRPLSRPPLLPNQQLIARSLNQQMIAQSLARQGRPTIPPVLPNQQLIDQSLACQGTPFIPPRLPNQQQQLVAQFLARQQTTRQHTVLRPPPLPDQQLAAQSLARQQTLRQHTALRLQNQRLAAAQSLARQRTLLIPPPATTTGSYIKYRDQTTPKPSGYKCLLCKRDVSYEPEGPISQPPLPPTVAVLSCGHTFHEYCLERITPDDRSKDPPCIPCALLE